MAVTQLILKYARRGEGCERRSRDLRASWADSPRISKKEPWGILEERKVGPEETHPLRLYPEDRQKELKQGRAGLDVLVSKLPDSCGS